MECMELEGQCEEELYNSALLDNITTEYHLSLIAIPLIPLLPLLFFPFPPSCSLHFPSYSTLVLPSKPGVLLQSAKGPDDVRVKVELTTERAVETQQRGV